MTHHNTPNGIPDFAHYAIVRGTSFHIPGDERSRTNPGHGYPASTENALTYESFTDRDEWQAAIERAYHDRQSFKALIVHVAEVTMKIELKEVTR